MRQAGIDRRRHPRQRNHSPACLRGHLNTPATTAFLFQPGQALFGITGLATVHRQRRHTGKLRDVLAPPPLAGPQHDPCTQRHISRNITRTRQLPQLSHLFRREIHTRINDHRRPRFHDQDHETLAHAPSITPDDFADAIADGERFLTDSPGTPGYDDYHRVLLGRLKMEPTAELLAELRRDVHPSVFLELFPDVLGTLDELKRRGVRMAVVSDAWPNLPDLHEGLSVRDYFEVYAISAELGCEKPDPRMYHHASDGLGLEPSQCLFVDDLPDLVSAAIGLGYEGRALCRKSSTTLVPSITSLTELLDIF